MQTISEYTSGAISLETTLQGLYVYFILKNMAFSLWTSTGLFKKILNINEKHWKGEGERVP